ncbi:DUF1972 domain-containing protein [Alteromonas sp. 5E99-2]|uniref:DUF1972 domain-containing protein n=1 Tax=Alteromonas sp. 5E99-2 TaxID=2817683 RepID=UPI001A994340|nr:DUF1972 domain-containing protein [Alteromonas sp. 5E99-2]MBO1254240.1 DUF1972 domain-containing protein [Alteromonas sp. 5E99-2]
MKNKKIVIQGIRGIPASHGGFETFAEYLVLYLVKKGWEVIVYCQGEPDSEFVEDEWRGIKRITIPEKRQGPLGTMIFDFKTIVHSTRHKCTVLTLGYNTASFNLVYRLMGIKNLINMDGIEWKRDKWGALAKTWFWLNERCGCWFGHHLVSDHPEIKKHLATRVSEQKITTIAYGGLEVTKADSEYLTEFELEPDTYGIVIARPEPENSVLEIVQGFSRSKRNKKLVVLGNFDFDNNQYHQQIKNSASDEVIFPGAIYDIEKVSALRFFARCYVHGHTVGGTNPSLVEAIGAGNAIIAHDNKFNRWVAKEGAIYFTDIDSISSAFDTLFENDTLTKQLQGNTKDNFVTNFQWDKILTEYEDLMIDYLM